MSSKKEVRSPSFCTIAGRSLRSKNVNRLELPRGNFSKLLRAGGAATTWCPYQSGYTLSGSYYRRVDVVERFRTRNHDTFSLSPWAPSFLLYLSCKIISSIDRTLPSERRKIPNRSFLPFNTFDSFIFDFGVGRLILSSEVLSANISRNFEIEDRDLCFGIVGNA